MTRIGHNIVMNRVKVSEFKSHLSEHLRKVRQGGEVIVTDRQTPIARVIPFSEKKSTLQYRKPKFKNPANLKKIKRLNKSLKVDPLEFLLQERSDR